MKESKQKVCLLLIALAIYLHTRPADSLASLNTTEDEERNISALLSLYYDLPYWDSNETIDPRIEEIVESIPPNLPDINVWVSTHIYHTDKVKKPIDSVFVRELLLTVYERGYAVSKCDGIARVWLYLAYRKGIGIPVFIITHNNDPDPRKRMYHASGALIVNGTVYQYYKIPGWIIWKVYVFDQAHVDIPAQHGFIPGQPIPKKVMYPWGIL